MAIEEGVIVECPKGESVDSLTEGEVGTRPAPVWMSPGRGEGERERYAIGADKKREASGCAVDKQQAAVLVKPHHVLSSPRH